MTGLTTHKADWKGNFLVVDQQTLNDLGGKADELLAASGDREAFAQSMREAVYRAHAEALQNYKTDGAKFYRMNQGVMFRELFTGKTTFAEYKDAVGDFGPKFLTPIPDAERDRIAEYGAKSLLEEYKTGRMCSGVGAGPPPKDETLVKAVTNPQLGPDAQTWKDGWSWASAWGAKKWGAILLYVDPRPKSDYVYVRYDPARLDSGIDHAAPRAELEAEAGAALSATDLEARLLPRPSITPGDPRTR